MELVLKPSKIKSTAVQLVLALIVKVKEACSFDIRWIKGRSGNKGQELAGPCEGSCQGKPTNKDPEGSLNKKRKIEYTSFFRGYAVKLPPEKR